MQDDRAVPPADNQATSEAPGTGHPAHPTRLQPLIPPAAFGAWLREGLRSAVFLAPRWPRLPMSPALLAGLVLLCLGLSMLVARLSVEGPARFYWPAIAGGWGGTVLMAWACYVVHGGAQAGAQTGMQTRPGAAPMAAPSTAHLFGLLVVLQFLFWLPMAGLQVVLIQGGMPLQALLRRASGGAPWGLWAAWGVWLLPLLWSAVAQMRVLARAGGPAGGRRAAAVLALLLAAVLASFAPRPPFWYAAPDLEAAAEESEAPTLDLTQERMEAQPRQLQARLAELKPQRRGVVDLYALTFAPYADEDVFRRESAMVAEVMQQRFDTEGRTLQLVNNLATLEQWPWATPLNLQRAIRRVAQLMDRDEDVLFIHLTSHGAQDGELAAEFWPMTVDAVTPAQLKAWLDEAGIRHRVISISACYSGSWVEPLADDGTLVMTAADADHTSYGCGRRSELTFYGRAVFDEQLRSHTRSFEQALAAARPVIEQREKDAGKDDGYSNPQIRVGPAIGGALEALRKRLDEPAKKEVLRLPA